MNQIARGGYNLTPPEEDTGVPRASRSQGPDPSLQLDSPREVRTADAATLRGGIEMGTRTCNNSLQVWETSH